MEHISLGKLYLKELEAEVAATRKCLERIPDNLFGWKPVEPSMAMGRLALTIAEIPRWISVGVKEGEISFGSFKHIDAKTAADFVKEFDNDMAGARAALVEVSDEDLQKMFELKSGDKVLMSSTRGDMVGSSINHLVHHRGQFTVYLRMNGIPVPSIYGPSGDDQTF